jgi:hypothetical protein
MTQQLAPMALASTPQQGRKRESGNRLDALSQQREAREAYRESERRDDVGLLRADACVLRSGVRSG